MKKILLLAAISDVSSPVLAKPYVNLEANANYTGDQYVSRATDVHVGYEADFKYGSWYVQGGKTFHTAENVGSDNNWSGKTGASIPVTEKVSVYGEVSFAHVEEEDADNTYATKLGTKFYF